MKDKDIEAFMDKLAGEETDIGSPTQFSDTERELAEMYQQLEDPDASELVENRKYALFQNRLEAYQAGFADAESQRSTSTTNKAIPFPRNLMGTSSLIAAAACLVISTIVFLNWNSNENTSHNELTQEVASLKNMLVLSLLSHEAPAQRMNGIHQAAQLESPSAEISDLLFSILNNDPNVNVRLAAISSLGGIDSATAGKLLDALPVQSSILVQLEIVHTVLNFGEEADQNRLIKLISESDLAPERATRFKHVINTGI
ncbi:MAG: HEAT repeat domain-containing protein [Opitutales bacterium]|nr:HEAT repeat domain-containing protein [Opitutales bacterium]